MLALTEMAIAKHDKWRIALEELERFFSDEKVRNLLQSLGQLLTVTARPCYAQNPPRGA
jgi:hypothetical protein